MRDKRLMFDFGGVIADSEVLANRALAEIVSERDVSTTLYWLSGHTPR